MLKFSIAGDTAKYLDFTLSRGGALSPQDSTCIETRSFRSLPLDQMDAYQTYHPYHLLSIWLSYCNLYDPGRAHIPCGCTRSFLTFGISNLFVPGWLSTSVIHKVDHRYGPCVTTQHNPNNHSTQVFHSLSCFIKQKDKSKT